MSLSIDFETGERITRITLTDWRDYLQKEIDDHVQNGTWLHPEDLPNNRDYIYCVNRILEAFGGELYGERQERGFDTTPTMVEASKRLEAYFLEIGKKRTQEKD